VRSLGGFDFPAYNSVAVLYLVLGAYLFVRWPFITEVGSAIATGRYFEYALSLAVQRYRNPELAITPFFNVGTVFFFLFAFLLGGFFATRRHWHKGLLALCFAGMVFIESSSLARTGVVISLVVFVVELLIRRNRFLHTAGQVKIWTYFGTAAIGAFLLLFIVGFLRVANKSYALEIVLLQQVPSYTISAYEALLVWLQSFSHSDYSFGYYTFASFFKILGVYVPQGLWEGVSTSFGETNLFLIYRGMLEDFGIIGATCLMFVLGFAIVQGSLGRPSFIRYLFLRFALLMVMFPLYSVFIFSTVSAAFVLSFVLVVLDRLYHLRQGVGAAFESQGSSPAQVTLTS
jgi:oligosaccharide repeat unit polymerase